MRKKKKNRARRVKRISRPTWVSVGLEQCLKEIAPAAPVRMSVRKRFSCMIARGAPVAASMTQNTPAPGGRPCSRFL